MTSACMAHGDKKMYKKKSVQERVKLCKDHETIHSYLNDLKDVAEKKNNTFL